MKRLSASLALLLVATAATAGGDAVYMEQTVKTSGVMGQPGTNAVQKVWMSDTAYRLEDTTSGVVTILRNDIGKVYIIQTAQKTYSELTKEQMKAMAGMGGAMLAGMGGGKSEPKTTLKVTDETAEVAGYKTYKAIVTLSGPMAVETTMWLARDVGIEMKQWAKLAEGMGAAALLGDGLEKMMELDGFPLRQLAKIKVMGMEVTTDTLVTKLEHVSATDDLFSLPAGLKKTEGMMPGMPGMPGSR